MISPRWEETTRALAAPAKNINTAAEDSFTPRTENKEWKMLQLEELKGKLPAYRVSLKEAGESL